MNIKVKGQFKLTGAEITAIDSIELKYSGKIPDLTIEDFKLNGLKIKSYNVKDGYILINTSEIDLSEIYFLTYKNHTKIKLEPGRVFDKFNTTKKLGMICKQGQTTFNLFAPRASMVKLVLFENVSEEEGKEYFLSKEDDGVWTLTIPQELYGYFYAYKISGPQDNTELFNPEILVADPYSRAVATKNSYDNEARTLIQKDVVFDWEGTDWQTTPIDKLVIYEAHLRDLTAHQSSLAKKPGTYKGFIENNIKGGINHLINLGVNAVEFLPMHEFQNWEAPFNKSYRGIKNTWNPYERNHWGYMTSFFFAPENYYASDGKINQGLWNGTDGRTTNEFKEVVKELHNKGISVILDVVYNHTSQYDYNPFKMIDKKYYYRLDEKMNFRSESGCGNDLKTERTLARKMIIESVIYWMTEYKIDGFRFDLAQLIDKETCKMILEEARKVNPNVIIIAEPWGGGYDPEGFSKIGWAAWNDKARNGIKGENPFSRKSFIFGEWDQDVNTEVLINYFKGTLKKYGGPFQLSDHAINYLESHDDMTLGDFIRLGIKKVNKNDIISDPKKTLTLNKQELKIHKLAALTLFTLQGPVMIHSGQEFAKSKVIAKTVSPDTNIGRIDHNSYNKDNETNYLNFEHLDWNIDLFNYYRGLISLRKQFPQLSKNSESNLTFLKNSTNPFALGYLNKSENNELLVLVNGNKNETTEFQLPEGNWKIIADGQKVYNEINKTKEVSKKIKVQPTEGYILVKQLKK